MLKVKKGDTGAEVEVNGMGADLMAELSMLVHALNERIPAHAIKEAVEIGLTDVDGLKAKLKDNLEELLDLLKKDGDKDDEEAKEELDGLFKKLRKRYED